MAKVAIKSILLLCNRSRSYATATATAVVQAAASAVRKANDSTATISGEKKESFWMKDPKTGNWIPETHFDDIDVVALREEFLPRSSPSPSPF